MILYHFTCDHARSKIIRSWVLKPNPASYGQLIWLTDLDQPDVAALGLTSFMLNCDRTAYRVTVGTDHAVPWTVWAHQNKVPSMIRFGLEAQPGVEPLHWWVSESPLDVKAIEPTFSKGNVR